MRVRASDLRAKEIVSVADGRRLGYLYDFEIDLRDGTIKSIVIPGQGKLFGVLGKGEEIIVPWERIRNIGQDVILLEDPDLPSPKDT